LEKHGSTKSNVSSHVEFGPNTRNYKDYGGWKPLNGRPKLCMAVWLQVKVRGCELELPIGCTPTLSVTQKCNCSCSMQIEALHICCMPLPI